MRKIIFSLLFVTVIVLMTSCKKDLPDPGTTATPNSSNGWWCTFKLGGVDIYHIGTFFLSTYNTSGSKDSIWIDDIHHSWDFKCKTKIDYSNLTFSTSNAVNESYPITVTIANGKILPKAGKSRAGNVTDSIYMEATFSDDPTNTYKISGTARTGFIEDDY